MRIVLLFLLLVLLPISASAEEPIDPLVRADEAYTWNLSLSYIPQGREGFAGDAHGRLFAYTLFSEDRSLSLSGTLQIAERLRVGLELTHSQWSVQEKRDYGLEDYEVITSAGGDFSFTLTSKHQLYPGSFLDPRLSLSFGSPTSGFEVSASLLLDPVVLVGAIGYTFTSGSPQQWMTVSFGAGFIANRWVSFTMTASYTVPVDGVGLPTASFSLRTRYFLDVEKQQELWARTSISLRGETVWMGLEIGLAGRGL